MAHSQQGWTNHRVVTLWAVGLAAMLPLLTAGCGGSPPPKAQQQAPPPAPPPPPAAPMTLADLSPVTLEPGKSAQVKVSVNRGAAQGPIAIETASLPNGISAKPLEIPAGKSEGQLEVSADQKLGDQEFKGELKVVAKSGGVQSEKKLAVTVKKLLLPTLVAGGERVMQPGATVTTDVTVNRNGFTGPLDLKVENLPPGVTATVSKVGATDNVAKLQITTAPTAPNSKQPLRVVASVLGRAVTVDQPLQVDAAPFQVKSFQVVNIRPGEKKRIEVPIERNSYKGKLDIESLGLPEGVSIKKVQVAPDQKSVALEIVAAETAKEMVRGAKVVAKGDNVSRTEALVVRVRREEEGFLPKEISADPELMPLLRRGSFGARLTNRSKQAMLDAYGGTPESEAAIMRGLKWLAAHQQTDGRWPLRDLDKDIPGCDCRASEKGKIVDKTKDVLEDDAAGTALALLAFLGAGVALDRSPEEPAELAQYRTNVRRGIGYLVSKQTLGKNKNDKSDGRLSGNMYAHAAATIALNEAYGLSTADMQEKLKLPAQRAIKYIANSQHKEGGWRYGPNQPGDMSAVAWQFLAIRSGQLAGLGSVGSDSLKRAERFVDSCAAGPQGLEDSQYSYMPGEGPEKAKLSLTAAGLLTRQYLLKWKKDTPALLAGCKVLMQNLPPESASTLGAAYYYYYATQVLHHMEGADFDLWNQRMREHLLRTQEKEGHRAGSWNPAGVDWGSSGGRIYATSLALMTLEVYYRHLPMYRYVARGKAAAVETGDEP